MKVFPYGGFFDEVKLEHKPSRCFVNFQKKKENREKIEAERAAQKETKERMAPKEKLIFFSLCGVFETDSV